MAIVESWPCLILWGRFGWVSLLAGIACAGLVDAISIALQQPLQDYPNYLLVWAVFPQLGYAWLDDRLAGAGGCLLLAAIGLVGLVLLVTVGPYPILTIAARTAAISEFGPRGLRMAFLGTLQAGLVLFLQAAVTWKPVTAAAMVIARLPVRGRFAVTVKASGL